MSTTTTPFVVDASRSPHAVLRPVPITAVRLADAFWEPRRRVNREKTLPSQFAHLEETGCLDNFRRAAGTKTDAPFRGFYFADSDLYKWLEAASSALLDGGEAAERLLPLIDEGISLIEAAQRPDGYVNTYFEVERADKRYTNLRDLHEFYCAGHFFQAAVAHHRATGGDRLLNVARRFADHLADTFGPAAEGKREGTDGHPEIELALVELYRATGETRYRDLAAYFVDARGRVPSVCYWPDEPADAKGGAYHQDHVPYRDLGDVTGHAVRMLYLAAGVTDLVLENGDDALEAAQRRQWENFVGRRMYVSGGAGSRWEGEAFGKDYELPASRAYTETCAAIASVMWAHRRLLLTGDARYADALEWTLYNAVLPGLSLDGEHYFYQNPLSDDGAHRRRPWFGCACCPPNVARLLAQLPGYFASTSDAGLYLHLYAAGEVEAVLPDGQTAAFTVWTDYPWSGVVQLTAKAAGEFSLFLRVPFWSEPGMAGVEVNGEAVPVSEPGAYTEIRRAWQPGDVVRFGIPMPVRLLEPHPYVSDAAGRVAFARGPLLFCAEGADYPGIDVRDLAPLPDATWLLTPVPSDGLPENVRALRGERAADLLHDAEAWKPGVLYRSVTRAESADAGHEPAPLDLTLVPYYAWANRDPGRMEVWLRRP